MQTCPTRNTKGSPLGWHERTVDSDLNPHAEIKSSSKGNYTGKYKRQYKYNFYL